MRVVVDTGVLIEVLEGSKLGENSLSWLVIVNYNQ